MKNKNKKITTYFILFSLLLIGVIYAILQANLQINGTAKIKANSWDIHFDNIQINENSVSIGTGHSAATIGPENNCKVVFSVTLSLPGDFYEFTVDVVNAGTIDGMVGTLTKTLKVNNEVVSEVPDYLNYFVTYSDGVEIEENHKLSAGSTETFLVRLELRSDIEELPQAATVETTLEPEYIQADSGAIYPPHPISLYYVFQTEANSGSGLVHEYTGGHKDSFTQTGTEKIYHWYADSSDTDSANSILDKWNVIFGGFCWQAYRTTDTGGVKLIYNGVPSDGKCNASGNERHIGKFKYNENLDSPAYVGYMIPDSSKIKNYQYGAATSGSRFGTGVTYVNGTYTLTNSITTMNNTHHYTCNNTTGSCSSVRYYYYKNDITTDQLYIELNGENDIGEALSNMLNNPNVNKYDSTIKTAIETWYQNNLTSYTSKLEDTIFCNNRSILNLNGFDPNGGEFSEMALHFKDFYYNTSSINLSCANVTDQFSLSNDKAQINYPVGLMNVSEAKLLNNNSLRFLSDESGWYWLGSALAFDFRSHLHSVYNTGYLFGSVANDSAGATRVVVSLAPGTMATSGDGSKNNPYVVE